MATTLYRDNNNYIAKGEVAPAAVQGVTKELTTEVDDAGNYIAETVRAYTDDATPAKGDIFN